MCVFMGWQNAVMQSRQFPFRFLAAYKAIMELHNLGETQILKRLRPTDGFQYEPYETNPVYFIVFSIKPEYDIFSSLSSSIKTASAHPSYGDPQEYPEDDSQEQTLP